MNKFVKKLAEQVKQSKTSSYDTNATVSYVDGDTAYVKISGSDIEDTPCKMTISCKQGDIIKVRVSGGRAYIIGNESSPPTDDSYAEYKLAIIDKLIAKTVKVGEVIGDKFKLSADGVLTCKDAVLSGTINAVKGKIGGWSIGESDESEFVGISYEDDQYQAFFAPDLFMLNDNQGGEGEYAGNKVRMHSGYIYVYDEDSGETEISGGKIVCDEIYADNIGHVESYTGTATSIEDAKVKSIYKFSLPAGTWVVTAIVDFGDTTDTDSPGSGSMQASFSEKQNSMGSIAQSLLYPSGNYHGYTMNLSWVFYPASTSIYYITCYSTHARKVSVNIRAMRCGKNS